MPNYKEMAFNTKFSKAIGESYGRTYQLPYISEDLGACECCRDRTGEFVSGGLLTLIPPGEIKSLGVPIEELYSHTKRLCDVCGLLFYAKFHRYPNKQQAIRILQQAQGYKVSHARIEAEEIINFQEVYRQEVEAAQAALEELQSHVVELEIKEESLFPILTEPHRIISIRRFEKYGYRIKLIKEK